MKLTGIRKRLNHHSEKRTIFSNEAPKSAIAEEIIQQIESKIELSNDTIINDDKIPKINQKKSKNISSQIQDVSLLESIPFWHMYLLKCAVISNSYSLIKYISFKVSCCTPSTDRNLFNKRLKNLNSALNKKGGQQIKKLRTKYRNFVKWSQEPESTWTSLIVVLGVLLYFIYPEEVIPDWIPIVGSIDDFIAILIVMAWLVDDLRENIIKLSEHELRKVILILKLIFIFVRSGGISAISSLLLMKIWQFLQL